MCTTIFILLLLLLCIGSSLSFRSVLRSKIVFGTALASVATANGNIDDNNNNNKVIGKTELLVKLQDKSGLNKKDSAAFLGAFTDLICEEVVGNGREVRLVGFGSFKPKTNAARSIKVPKSGVMKDIPACKTMRFSVSPTVKIAE